MVSTVLAVVLTAEALDIRVIPVPVDGGETVIVRVAVDPVPVALLATNVTV
jgi:hypothetical protein